MYAIVDIETTGGFAQEHRIIEIAVIIHDGKKEVESFQTLINPGRRIPPYIAAFTNISDEMVADAPAFSSIAHQLFALLEGKVFVAHNVNFDYSFIQKELEKCAIQYQAHRLCTIKLSRQIFPGKKSYSLTNITASLDIELKNAHRAYGDCKATAALFSLLVRSDMDQVISKAMKKNTGDINLPPNIDRKDFQALPAKPGVYYFLDKSGKTIYVGKATNIKKRVSTHFTGKLAGERKQQFFREIHHINYELCGTELIALLLEAQEIKRLWPRYNTAQKNLDLRYGIYDFTDGRGILNLGIEKARKFSRPLLSFQTLWEARNFMEEMVRKHYLERGYCSLEKLDVLNGLSPIARSVENIREYNAKVQQAVEHVTSQKETFAVISSGRDEAEHSAILVQEGAFSGYGFISRETGITSMEHLQEHIKPCKATNESYWLIRQYIQKDASAKVLKF